ncbi:MAG: hypothetical protein ACRELZ_15195 [Candidatus Rokuibacteriota bacterium]
MAILWTSMMLVWLAGLLYGLWWIWPLVERMTLSADLVMASVWLIIGAAAWLVALNLGLRRYRPRKD